LGIYVSSVFYEITSQVEASFAGSEDEGSASPLLTDIDINSVGKKSLYARHVSR
jgi:hypothetical protein